MSPSTRFTSGLSLQEQSTARAISRSSNLSSQKWKRFCQCHVNQSGRPNSPGVSFLIPCGLGLSGSSILAVIWNKFVYVWRPHFILACHLWLTQILPNLLNRPCRTISSCWIRTSIPVSFPPTGQWVVVLQVKAPVMESPFAICHDPRVAFEFFNRENPYCKAWHWVFFYTQCHSMYFFNIFWQSAHDMDREAQNLRSWM